jgi:plasmid maintenance system antidote protein VapI
MKETFGSYTHRLRSYNGLTLTKLAAVFDVCQFTFSKIRNGKRNVTEVFKAAEGKAKYFGAIRTQQGTIKF